MRRGCVGGGKLAVTRACGARTRLTSEAVRTDEECQAAHDRWHTVTSTSNNYS